MVVVLCRNLEIGGFQLEILQKKRFENYFKELDDGLLKLTDAVIFRTEESIDCRRNRTVKDN